MIIDWRKAVCPAVLLGALTFLIHLAFNGGYGIFRDELYFIVCGQRLAWGYVDQPPLVPLIAAWSYTLAGDWLTGFRLVPALAMAFTVGLTAEFTRLLGGGKFAQWLAGLCALGAPHFLAIGLLFTTDTFQALSWLACAYILLRLEQTRDERWWLAFGAVVGVSLMTKYMIAFFVVALAAGLLLTVLRRSLLRPWVYAGAVLAVVIVAPNLWWQAAHDWPFRELGQAAMHGKNIALSPVSFFSQQLLLMGPLAAAVWLAGLWVCVRKPTFAFYRAVAVAYGLLFAFFVATHGKAYYLTSIYPILFAIGAIAIERWVANAMVRAVALGAVVLLSALIAPLAIPVLSEEAYIRYAAALGMGPSATAAEHLKQGRLPQHFADMHGWPAMAAKVAAVYHALPPGERAKAVFFANNYGEAAAIDVYGRKLGLPAAISGHNNYWLWGPQGHDGSVVIAIGGEPKDYEHYGTVHLAGRTNDPYAMPYETGQPIYVLKGRNLSLVRAWPDFKHFE